MPGPWWLDEPELNLSGTRFQAISSAGTFRTGAVAELERRPDREKFNLPSGLTSVETMEVGNAWLPTYVVECVTGLLVYTKAVDGDDSYLAKLMTPYLRDVLAAEVRSDDVRVWREWLDGRGFGDVEPRRLPNRVLRAALPAAAFGKDLQWWQLGSFEVRKRSFLQLWCDDAAARRRAVLTRAGAVVARRGIRDRDGLGRRLADLAKQLDVPAPTVAHLAAYARNTRDEAVMMELNKITAADPSVPPD